MSTISRGPSNAGTPRRRELGDGNNRQFDPSSAGNQEESNASVCCMCAVLMQDMHNSRCLLMSTSNALILMSWLCRKHHASIPIAQCMLLVSAFHSLLVRLTFGHMSAFGAPTSTLMTPRLVRAAFCASLWTTRIWSHATNGWLNRSEQLLFCLRGGPPCLTSDCMKMADTDEWHVDMDCTHLRQHDPDLYRQLVRYPQVRYGQ